MKTALFERFSVHLPDPCVADCSASGAVDSAVAHWADRIELTIPADKLRAELAEYGAWDAEELADDEASKRRIIWIAACNIRDEERETNRQLNR